MESRQEYKVCQHLFDFAKKKVLVGSNWGPDTKIGENTFLKGKLLFYDPPDKSEEEKDFYRELFGKKDIREFDKVDKNPLFDIENKILQIDKYSAGNCHEFQYIMLYYCAINNIPAEGFSLNNIDHCAVVLWRDPTSDPTKPETWSKNKNNEDKNEEKIALICDPWMGTFFPVSEAIIRYQDFFHTTKEITLTINNIFQEKFDISLRTEKMLKDFFKDSMTNLVKLLKQRRKELLSDDKKLETLSLFFRAHIKNIDLTIDYFENKFDSIFEACEKKAIEEIKKIDLIESNKKYIISTQLLDKFSLTRKYLLSDVERGEELLNNFPAYFELQRMVSVILEKSIPPKKELFHIISLDMLNILNKGANDKFSIKNIRILFKNILWIVLQQDKENKGIFSFFDHQDEPISSLIMQQLIKDNQLNELLKIIDIELSNKLNYQQFIRYLTGCTDKRLFHPKFLKDCETIGKLHRDYVFTMDESKKRISYRLNASAVTEFPQEVIKNLIPLLEDFIAKKDSDSIFKILKNQSSDVKNSCFPRLLELFATANEQSNITLLLHMIREEKDNSYSQVSLALYALETNPTAANLLAKLADKIIPIPTDATPFSDLLSVRELYFAAQDGDLETVKKHIELKTPLNYRYCDFTVLSVAVEYNKTECVRVLLEANVNIDLDMRDPTTNPLSKYTGDTPLHTAIKCHFFESAVLLIKAGADLSMQDADSRSALELIEKLTEDNQKDCLKAAVREIQSRSSVKNTK